MRDQVSTWNTDWRRDCSSTKWHNMWHKIETKNHRNPQPSHSKLTNNTTTTNSGSRQEKRAPKWTLTKNPHAALCSRDRKKRLPLFILLYPAQNRFRADSASLQHQKLSSFFPLAKLQYQSSPQWNWTGQHQSNNKLIVMCVCVCVPAGDVLSSPADSDAVSPRCSGFYFLQRSTCMAPRDPQCYNYFRAIKDSKN